MRQQHKGVKKALARGVLANSFENKKSIGFTAKQNGPGVKAS